MIAVFFGHGDFIENEHTKQRLYDAIHTAISMGADNFYVGGYGRFDACAAEAVREIKKTHEGITLTLVLAYPDRSFDASLYDDTIYPPIENTPRRYAIVKRNRYMAEECGMVIAYIVRNHGGAAKAVQYAQRLGRKILFCE